MRSMEVFGFIMWILALSVCAFAGFGLAWVFSTIAACIFSQLWMPQLLERWF